MISSNGILYIEPSKKVSDEPLIDEATRKMVAALRLALPSPSYRGFHECACGARSSNCDYKLPNGEMTNSLSVHYLAYHRDEISDEHLSKVLELKFGEAEPTIEEMRAGMRGEATKEISSEYQHNFKMR